MSNLQRCFNEFHEIIKLDVENVDLRRSRDAIKSKLGSRLREYFEDKAINVPTFFDQGSYAIGTGVKPIDSEDNYDIDVGVKFDIYSDDYPDPLEIKKSVKEALSGHTKLGVKIKEPCIRVIYSEDGEEKYHVDLAIYAINGQTARGSVIYLGRGKEFSTKENKYWETSQPELLIDLICNKFSFKDDRSQFRRLVRYLKRWKDLSFSSLGNSAPTGIAITILAYQYFVPAFTTDGSPSDIEALIDLFNKVKNSAQQIYFNGEYVTRLTCNLPVQPNNDLFLKMTNNQMERFLKKLNELYEVLINVSNDPDDDEACLALGVVFGDDFPSPDISKAFHSLRKPNLGYYPTPEVVKGFEEASYNISINGFVYVKNKAIPIPSNKKILGNGRRLEFRALSRVPGDGVDYYWRVFNTGKHVSQISQTKIDKTETFRGDLFKARIIKIVNGQFTIVPSQNQLLNQEGTTYTGKHWIECIAFKNGVCVGKSKPFYVNVYNPNFPDYD